MEKKTDISPMKTLQPRPPSVERKQHVRTTKFLKISEATSPYNEFSANNLNTTSKLKSKNSNKSFDMTYQPPILHPAEHNLTRNKYLSVKTKNDDITILHSRHNTGNLLSTPLNNNNNNNGNLNANLLPPKNNDPKIAELQKIIDQQALKIIALESERNQLREAALQATYTPAAFLSDEVNFFNSLLM